MLEVYTDGACSGNPGPGGWAYLVVSESGTETMARSGPIALTTNNKMELQAAIEALHDTPKTLPIRVISDSQLLVKTMLGEWKKHTNYKQWLELEALCKDRQVEWEWRKRNSNEYMEKVDKAAHSHAKAK